MEDDEPPFYVVRHVGGGIPDEHYCAEHLISERDYLAKHGLQTSESVDVEPNEDGEACDAPGCPNVANHNPQDDA
jgi:hypothetical protein